MNPSLPIVLVILAGACACGEPSSLKKKPSSMLTC